VRGRPAGSCRANPCVVADDWVAQHAEAVHLGLDDIARLQQPLRVPGVPMWAILSSTVVGFACVVAAYVAPDTVFLFLLNSSGAIILFVYPLLCLSQLRMRPRTPPELLRVKMWFPPCSRC
jgi:L-asparagine transporter-like permease